METSRQAEEGFQHHLNIVHWVVISVNTTPFENVVLGINPSIQIVMIRLCDAKFLVRKKVFELAEWWVEGAFEIDRVGAKQSCDQTISS
jgi:hypothetical protein